MRTSLERSASHLLHSAFFGYLYAAFTLLLVISPGLGLDTAGAYDTEHVVLVIVDGLRYSEGLGDPSHTYVPEMWALSQEGAMIEPFLNDGFTYTSRAIPAIWCGAWTEIYTFNDPDCGGQSNNYTQLPTVFEYYRKQLGCPEDDCIYVLKDVGCPWKASMDPDYGTSYWPLYHSEGWTDQDVWLEAQQILNDYTPSFFLLYLAGVDGAGHSGDWDQYTNAITVADGIVGALWDFLQAHPHYAGTTTMFVTNDHGRHSYDFSGHGDDCYGCRTIQLLAVGPDIQAGLVSTVTRTLRDITPTIGELLGFTAEDATGTVMEEILLLESGVEDETDAFDFSIRAVPNPFNAGTELRFRVPTAGVARISIHDVNGRLVDTPFEEFVQPGPHSYHWRAVGPDGRRLPSAVYFLTLTASDKSASQRIVLVK
jgi:hypothetical protein